ncbi:MAG: isoprenyl transferase [Bdellovibrionales bacterium]|nr:isoprenyl transferase [Bdellovibrionales bacterium]
MTTPEKNPLPKHVAVIMDGNGRWARARGLGRLEGHRAGAKAVREIVEGCAKRGIQYLTLFSFSTENWNRSRDEVAGLMKLFRRYLDSELQSLTENNVRLRAIGDIQRLPFTVRDALERDIERTKDNSGLNLVLAISYGAREEILRATRRLAAEAAAGTLAPDAISEEDISRSLWTADMPDPDLLIRTSGELRVSNFLLWQIAYAEMVIVPEYWPEFDDAILQRCLDEYAGRERRFGLTSEQLEKSLAS